MKETKYEKMLKKITLKNLQLAIIGKIFIAITIGAILTEKIILYAEAIRFIGLLIMIIFVTKSIIGWHNKNLLKARCYTIGFLGLIMMLIAEGTKNPEMPIKNLLLITGIILLTPAIWNIIKK